jgi:hypothetical protein
MQFGGNGALGSTVVAVYLSCVLKFILGKLTIHEEPCEILPTADLA